MAKQETFNLSPETVKEMPMVDIVYELLKQSDEPLYYRDLVKRIADLKEYSEEDMLSYMAQLYTEVNIDGRFICVGRNLWDLKERYTMEQSTDAAVAANMKDDDDFDDEVYDDDIEEEDDDEELLDVDREEYDSDLDTDPNEY